MLVANSRDADSDDVGTPAMRKRRQVRSGLARVAVPLSRRAADAVYAATFLATASVSGSERARRNGAASGGGASRRARRHAGGRDRAQQAAPRRGAL